MHIMMGSVLLVQTWLGWYIMAFILLFDSAYAWSWGPLGWVYPFGVPFNCHPIYSNLNCCYS